MRHLAQLLVSPAIAVILLAVTASPTLADERLGGKVRFGPSVTVPAGETVPGDLYVYGRTIDIAGTIQGDLIAVGGTVTLSGRVDGDALIAGGTVSVSGAVQGDARIVAGMATMSGPVAGDLAIQKPRPLHENGTSRSRPHAPHRNRANPPASHPHRRKSRNSCSTKPGRPSPSRRSAA
jgi:hypothetical protein